MERDFTEVQGKSKEKFAYVDVIFEAMSQRGWKAVDLSRASGVKEATISRTLKGGRGASAPNLYSLLTALDLIKKGGESEKPSYPYPEAHREVHEDVNSIMSLGSEEHINDLKARVLALKTREAEVRRIDDKLGTMNDRLEDILTVLKTEGDTMKGMLVSLVSPTKDKARAKSVK